MGGTTRTPQCPQPETLAAFAEGKLSRAEIARLLPHIERCSSCTSAIESAAHVLREPQSSARRWLVAAAAAVVILVAIPLVRTLVPSPIRQLIADAPRDERILEPRLTGGFPYAPFHGPQRAGGAATDAARMKRVGIAGELTERADHKATAAAERDAAVALLMIEQPLPAVDRLRLATQREPQRAQTWSDLSAALYAAARQLDRPSLYPQALDAADRALRIQPDCVEALFNRALVLERLGLTPAARDAWQHYLTADPSSPWAVEARQRLAKLSTPTSSTLFDRDRPRLESAAAREDIATVRDLVARYPQQARTWSEFDYLSRWAAAARTGDEATAARALAMAQTIGNALVKHSGESLLHDAAAIAKATPRGRARDALIDAQLLYKEGRIAYNRQQLAEAQSALQQSAARFASVHSPMAFVARYFAANARFDGNDIAGSCAELTELLRQSETLPNYAALAAQIRWQLSLCMMFDGDWTAAREHLTAAGSIFDRLGERNNLGFIYGLLATAQVSCGTTEDAWRSRVRAFEILSSEAHGDRLAASVAGAARLEIRAGRYESARALLAVDELLARETNNDVLLADVVVRRSIIDAALADASAVEHAHEARAIAMRIKDPELREMSEANANFAEGAASLAADPRLAAEKLTRAIDFYRRTASPAFLPDAYLMRARTAMQRGDRVAALRDVDEGIAAAERHRVQFAGGVQGAGVLEAEPELLLESIRLRLDGNDAEGAFASAERFNAQLAPIRQDVVLMAEVQRRLVGSDAAVLSIAVLPREVVAFAISANKRAVARTAVERPWVLALANACASGDARAADDLYDVLLRPSEPILASSRSVIVVAPASLSMLPFAALHDARTRRYAVESWAVSVAPSAGALRAEQAADRPKSAVAVALSATSNEAALPESAAEVADVSRLYVDGQAITGARESFEEFAASAETADIVHLASHTERAAATDDYAFVFNGTQVSWRTIAEMHLRRGATVLLAACETLKPLDAPGGRALSLGGGFIAAGAGAVIGTLTPIRDSDARSLFLHIHRRLAAGDDPASAVRAAQLTEIVRERATARRGAWRAVALLTRCIPQRRRA